MLTDRLILQQPAKNDFTRFFEINADPQTNLFNPNGAMSLNTATNVFTEIMQHWNATGYGTWSIREKQHPDFVIGFGGLAARPYGNEMKLNLGYRFDKDVWGKGYATELAQFAIHFGLHTLHKKEIFAIVRPSHLASIRVLEKCNMKLAGELDDVPNEKNSLVFKIAR
jgi:ribosomal-protein-alanine N-acetyltransferase